MCETMKLVNVAERKMKARHNNAVVLQAEKYNLIGRRMNFIKKIVRPTFEVGPRPYVSKQTHKQTLFIAGFLGGGYT